MSTTTNFGRKFCTYLQASEGWETTWVEALQKGSINIDSAKIIRSDRYHWCYILPVVKRDSLTGIIVAQIIAKETKEDKNYSIQLNTDTYISELKFLDLSDDNSYSHSSYFSNYKRPIYYAKNKRTRMICTNNDFVHFAYTYEYESYSTEDYCVSGTKDGLMVSLDYFKSLENTFEYYTIGNFGLDITFICGELGCEGLPNLAYEFAFMFNNYLEEQGYMSRILPMFNIYGDIDGDSSIGSDGSSGGGISTGSDGGGSVPGGGGIGTTNPSTNPYPQPDPVCPHVMCIECQKPIFENNGSSTRSAPNCSHSAFCSHWWGSGHNKLMKDALNDLTLEQLDSVKSGSTEIDKGDFQKVDYSHCHAMVREGQTTAQAISEMREHFIRTISAFHGGSYRNLGVALHMIQDAYSPAHSLNDWDGKTISYLPHIFEGRLFNRPEFQDALEATKYIYQQIKNCESNNESIGEIFDNWIDRYVKEFKK